MTTVSTGAELAAELQRIGREFKRQELDKILPKLALDGWRFAVKKTPVDTGLLRSNWSVDKAGRTTDTRKGVKGRRYGAPKQPAVSGFKWGDKVTIYNNTEYAQFVDPKQPMVRPTYYYLLAKARSLAQRANSRRY